MNILSVDVGKKRTGICLFLEGILLPQDSFQTPLLQEKVAFYIKEYSIEKIVVGLPLSAEGEMTEMAQWIKAETEKLDIPKSADLTFFNERLTTKEAEGILKGDDLNSGSRMNIDSISAMVILKEYLNNEKE